MERSVNRAIPDEQYEAVGATMVPENSWMNDPETAKEGDVIAPKDAVVIGLKNIPEKEPTSLRHRHLYFGHIFKGQPGAFELLSRYRRGGGTLLDVEFLMGDDGRRVSAFGWTAGYVGMCVGLLQLAAQKGVDYSLTRHKGFTYKELTDHVADNLTKGFGGEAWKEGKGSPNGLAALVIGTPGRCASGAVAAAMDVGLTNIDGWGEADTAGRTQFPEVKSDYDIVANCLLLAPAPNPMRFMQPEDVKIPAKDRRLRVVTDVSCDPSSIANPFPIYETETNFENPAVNVGEKLDVVAIDHLPSLVPIESSTGFGAGLMESLLMFPNGKRWDDLFNMYEAHCKKHL